MVLPASEIAVYAGNLIARKVLRLRGVAPYIPDFQEAAQHICIHTGAWIVRVVQFIDDATKRFIRLSGGLSATAPALHAACDAWQGITGIKMQRLYTVAQVGAASLTLSRASWACPRSTLSHPARRCTATAT